jgi:hypothetical protein
MTNTKMSLRMLLEKSSDAEPLREMIGFSAEWLMALEVESLTGAAHGERSPERITQRNGCCARLGDARHGSIRRRRQWASREYAASITRIREAASTGRLQMQISIASSILSMSGANWPCVRFRAKSTYLTWLREVVRPQPGAERGRV